MSNRDDLLAGAKRCLQEKGYAHTTARDIASAAGTSLAAIGYHFGSKEALLNAAMFELYDSWGERFATEVATETVDDPFERFEKRWTRILAILDADPAMVAASFEAFLQVGHSPELRAQMAAGNREGRRGLIASIEGIDEGTVTEEQERTLGVFYSALFSGIAAQFLVDPDHPPTGHDLAAALRAITAPGSGESPA